MDSIPFSRPRLWKNKADFFRPFRTAAAASAAVAQAASLSSSSTQTGENIAPLYDPTLHRHRSSFDDDREPDLKHLNAALAALVDIFPDIEPEVFREMLLGVSDESRLQVVTEHLLTKKAKWVRGRYRTPEESSNSSSGSPSKIAAKRKATQRHRYRDDEKSHDAIVVLVPDERESIPEEATFRSDAYRKAVKQVFYQEFKTLSHSSIRAVLAEQNFSYTFARPILQQLVNKSWRFSLSNLWSKKSASTVASDHPFIVWHPNDAATNGHTPAVRRTGNAQLDHELYELFVAPVLIGQQQAQLSGDYGLAVQINEKEAESAEALYDCECCYSSVPFESLSVCDDGCHQLCFDCVRRTVNEALFGQGWARTVDLKKSSVRCFASASDECNGVISPELVRRALSAGSDNDDAWNEFQLRAASDALLKSQLSLHRCPFCSYAEVDETPRLRVRPFKLLRPHVSADASTMTRITWTILILSLILCSIPIVLAALVIWTTLAHYASPATLLASSWSRIQHKRRGLKFHCRNPACGKRSCLRCQARWQDPHSCFENQKTSLRTAIEASATAAVKRTCPKCLLSFVKSSGCNKLVCNCGYTMCYICRQEITSKEGYSHFCQHFRPHGGRCTECERCDLYGDEDEELAIRRAAEEAERVWREKEGSAERKNEDGAGGASDDQATRAMVETLLGQRRGVKWWESWLDAVVEAVAV